MKVCTGEKERVNASGAHLAQARWSAALVAVVLLGVCRVDVPAMARAPVAFSAERAPLAVRVGETVVEYRVFGTFVMPGETVSIRPANAGAPARCFVRSAGHGWRQRSNGSWEGRAPRAPGVYPVTVLEDGTGETITINLFVLVPASSMAGGRLEGFRIDAYPRPLRGLAAYRAPRGYVRFTPDIVGARVSPHFTLAQFLCKQEAGPTTFLTLRPALLVKLERLLERVNAAGFGARTLTVMSGYRTPFYNRGLGNTPNSRHIYGDAADVFVDADDDGVMDDLDGNGSSDHRDAAFLLRMADEVDRSADVTQGGAGAYRATAAHGPFVHVDARGTTARW